MEKIIAEYRKRVEKYCEFANTKLDEVSSGKLQLADIDIESMVRTSNMLVVTCHRIFTNQPL